MRAMGYVFGENYFIKPEEKWAENKDDWGRFQVSMKRRVNSELTAS
jgi:hypothetical protein